MTTYANKNYPNQKATWSHSYGSRVPFMQLSKMVLYFSFLVPAFPLLMDFMEVSFAPFSFNISMILQLISVIDSSWFPFLKMALRAMDKGVSSLSISASISEPASTKYFTQSTSAFLTAVCNAVCFDFSVKANFSKHGCKLSEASDPSKRLCCIYSYVFKLDK